MINTAKKGKEHVTVLSEQKLIDGIKRIMGKRSVKRTIKDYAQTFFEISFALSGLSILLEEMGYKK